MSAPQPDPVPELRHRFAYHPPANEHVARAHETMRERMLEAALSVIVYVPAGREQALAITKLEEAMMWANAGIARANDPR